MYLYTSTCPKIRILHKVLIIFGFTFFYSKVALVSINEVLCSNFKQHSTVSAVNVKRSDHICEYEYHSFHKIRIFSSSAVKWLATNVRSKIPIDTQWVYKMGRSSDLTCEQQMVIKALSTAGNTQGEISRHRLFSVCCEQVSARQAIGRKKCGRKRATSKRDDRELAKLVCSDQFHNCGEIAQKWNADGVPASRSTSYRRIKEMGYANTYHR